MEISYDPAPVTFGSVNYPSVVFVDQPIVVGPEQTYLQGGSSNSIQIQGSAAGTYLVPGY